MRIATRQLEHPTQASRVVLNVYQLPEGWLLTEERVGTRRVVATLGVFPSSEAALTRFRARADQLRAQQFRPAEGPVSSPAA